MTQITPQRQGSKYTNNERRHALAVFVVLGNFQATSKETRIPSRTIQDWAKKGWWLNAIEEVRAEKSEELDAQVSNSIAKALESVDNRLEHGDAYINTKTGELGYKPVSARDSATVFGIMYDKRSLMRGMPTNITQSTDSAKLLKLQEKFEELARRKTKIIEGEVVNDGTLPSN